AQFGLVHWLFGAGRNVDVYCGLIDWRLDFVTHGRCRTQIGDHSVEIASSEHFVEAVGHNRRELHTSWTNSFHDRLLDVALAPCADASFVVRRNVSAFHLEAWLIPMSAVRPNTAAWYQ